MVPGRLLGAVRRLLRLQQTAFCILDGPSLARVGSCVSQSSPGQGDPKDSYHSPSKVPKQKQPRALSWEPPMLGPSTFLHKVLHCSVDALIDPH